MWLVALIELPLVQQPRARGFHLLEAGDTKVFCNRQHRSSLIVVAKHLATIADDKQARVGIENGQKVVSV